MQRQTEALEAADITVETCSSIFHGTLQFQDYNSAIYILSIYWNENTARESLFKKVKHRWAEHMPHIKYS